MQTIFPTKQYLISLVLRHFHILRHKYLFFIFPFQLIPKSLQLRKNDPKKWWSKDKALVFTVINNLLGAKTVREVIHLYCLKIVTLITSLEKENLIERHENVQKLFSSKISLCSVFLNNLCSQIFESTLDKLITQKRFLG